jgi:hypothetical protein
MAWSETIQEWGGLLVKGAVDREFYQDFKTDELRLKALGDYGYYDEGQRGIVPTPGSIGLQLPAGMLLLGAGVLLIFLLKD